MSDRTHYQIMVEYNNWMNQKLYAICAEIPDEMNHIPTLTYGQPIVSFPPICPD